MIDKDYLVGVFNNILPATFQDSVTYLEQLILLRDKVNEIIEIVNGIVDGGGSGYILPVASSEKLGGIKVGDRLTIDENGVLSADEQGGGEVVESTTFIAGNGISIESDLESDNKLIYVNFGEGITLGDGVVDDEGHWKYPIIVSVDNSTIKFNEQGQLVAENQGGGGGGESYTLPPANFYTLGGVKVGDGYPSIFNDKQAVLDTLNNVIYMRVGEGLEAVNGMEQGGIIIPGFLKLKIGTGLYFDSNGALCASGGGSEIITTGIADEITTQTTQNEGSGMIEQIMVDDSVVITKF